MIYDCFTFNGELDLLEIRLNILDKYVDRFVLYESEQTFSGKPKPLYYKENAVRYDRWAHKITWVEGFAKDFPDAFQRAGFQKDSIRESLLESHIKVKDEDIIYFGDVDEIWKPQEITDNKVYNLRQLNYSYYLNNRSSEEWIGTIVGRWKTIKTKSFNHWRANHTNVLDGGGWHFQNLGGPDQIRRKLESYDHQEFNTEDIKEDVEFRMINGEDYVGRKLDWRGKPFRFWIDEVDLPQYLRDNKDKYAHLFAQS